MPRRNIVNNSQGPLDTTGAKHGHKPTRQNAIFLEIFEN